MLILTRRHGESVRLSMDGIELGTITLIKNQEGSIDKLGFDLHPKLTITRSELSQTYEKGYVEKN